MSDEMNLDSNMVLYDMRFKRTYVALSTVKMPKLETEREFVEAFQFKENSVKALEKSKETLRSNPSEFWDRVIADQTYKTSADRYQQALAQLLYEVAPQLFKEHVPQGEENV